MVARMGPTGPCGVPAIVMVLVEDLFLVGHLLVSKSSSQSRWTGCSQREREVMTVSEVDMLGQ